MIAAFALLLLLAIPQLPAPEAADPTETWTVLYYMCADSSLESELIGDFNELERVGSTSDVNILVQMDRAPGDRDRTNGDWTDARRFRVERDSSTDSVMRSTEIENWGGEVDMTDPDVLKEFLQWGIAEYDSDHFMLIIGGHGKGPGEGLCTDLGASLSMSPKDFGKAFRSVGIRFDIVSLDMCWMGTAEIAAELTGYADYFIGSMDEIPDTGWPYDKCLPLILDNDGSMGSRLSSVVDEFMESYDTDGFHQYATLSVVDLDAFQGAFVPAWNDLSESLFYTAYAKKGTYPKILSSADHAKNDETIIDAFEMASLLSGSTEVPQLVKERAKSLLAIRDEVIPAHASGKFHGAGSSAFGINFGKPDRWTNYEMLRFSGVTAWDEFILMITTGIDARPARLNWSASPEQRFKFTLRTGTSGVDNVIVEAGDGVVFSNHTCSVMSGGYFYQMDRAGRTFLFYRYRVQTSEGTITFPPDGFEEVRYQKEGKGPTLLHWPPALLDPSQDRLNAYVWDDSGVDLVKSALYYRAKGETKYYSSPLEVRVYDQFTGILSVGSKVDSIEAGSAVEYYYSAKDVNGNEARYPLSGHYQTVIGQGKNFYIDMRHSSAEGYGVLESMLNASFIIGVKGEDPITEESLSGYDGYMLLEPTYSFTASEVDALSKFHTNGGDMLIVMDPGSSAQLSVGASLLELVNLEQGKSFGGGMLSSDPGTVLGGSLPTVSVPSGGTFEALTGSKSVYLAPGAGTMLSTSVLGKGRSFTAVPDLFSDEFMGRSGNRALLGKVLSTLSSNTIPTIKIVQSPPGVVIPGNKVVFDLSGSSDPDGRIVSYSIKIEKTYAESQTPRFEHIFTETGLYTIAFTATDSDGAIATSQISAIVNRPPSGEVGVSETTIHSGDLVIFNYKGSDPDGDQITLEWDFGDGVKAGAPTAYHTYRDRGKYNATMTVRDSYGLKTIWKETVTVLNSDPGAVIDRDQVLVNERDPTWTGPQKVTLQAFEGDLLFVDSDGSTDPDQGDDLNFSWKIGTETIYGGILLYTLKTQGLITIVLRVDDGFGGVDETNLTVHVMNEAPKAAFTVRQTGSRMEFSGQAIDDPWDVQGIEYRWDFGDGKKQTTTGPHVEHRYAFGGRYTVNLTVVDPDGGEGYYEMRIESGGITALQAFLLTVIVLVGIAGIASGIYFYTKAKMAREDKGLSDMISGKRKVPPPPQPVYRSFSSVGGKRIDLTSSRTVPRARVLKGRKD